ncbi:hypothetical protein WA158_003107 [Blastocystis sp. Blastoise]
MIIVFAYFYLIVFSQCSPPKLSFILRREYSSYSYEESWKIYEGIDDTGQLIYEGSATVFESNTVKEFDICLEFNKQYTLYMFDVFGDGWGSASLPSLLKILYDSQLLITTTLPHGDSGPKKELFKFIVPISPSSFWKYTSIPFSSSSWTSNSYIDTTWNTGIHQQFPLYSSITTYYRYTTSILDLNAYVYHIKLTTQAGAILYINGNEIYRINLPEGLITATTPASSIEPEPVTLIISIPAKMYQVTSLTVAVEIHIIQSLLNTADPFELYILPGSDEDDGIRFGSDAAGLCDPDVTSTSESCLNLFDNYKYSYYITPEGITTPTITIILSHQSASWINGYMLISGSDATRDPTKWKVYGSNNHGETWKLIDMRNDELFEGRRTANVYSLPSNRMIFNQFKFNFLSTTGGSRFQLAEIHLMFLPIDLLPIGLYYEQALYAIKTDISFSIYPISSGYISYSISSSLPSGLYIDIENGHIYGIPVGDSSTVIYTVTATEAATNEISTFSLTLAITGCIQPSMSTIYITKVNKQTSGDEQWTLYTQMNTIIYQSQGVNNGENQVYSECIPAGIYRLGLSDDGNNGWETGAYIDISLHYDATTRFPLTRLYLLSGTSNYYRINTKMYLPPFSTWKYSHGNPMDINWMESTYNDNQWLSISALNKLSFSTPLVLLRKTFSIELEQYRSGWILYFKVKAGTIIYINNKEVYRIFLPKGSITSSTTPTGGDIHFKWRYVTGSIQTLGTSNTITIAIAHINTISTSYLFDFDCVLYTMADNTTPLPIDGIAYASSLGLDGKAEYAFDSNIYTRYISGLHDSITPLSISIVFNNYNSIYSNEYCIISNRDSPQHDPIDWTIYGTEDGEQYVQLSSQIHISWEERLQRQCFYIPTLEKAYRGYKMTMTKTATILDQNRYAFSEYEIYMIDLDSLIIPPLYLTPKEIIAYKGIAVPALSTTSAYYYDFSISPDLPFPLTLDSSNGYINGIPITLLPPTLYTITAKNIKNIESSTTITLSVIQCSSPNILFTLEFYFSSDGIEASWSLNDPIVGNVIFSRTYSVSYTTQHYSFCRLPQIYSLVLSDSMNNGWGDGQYTIYLEDGTVVHTGTVENGESPKTVTLVIGRLLNPTEGHWTILNTDQQAPADWSILSFDDNHWYSASGSSLPIPMGITQYYRTKFTINILLPLYSGIEIMAKTFAGMIVYLNGHEIRRINLPSGIIDKNTLATQDTSDNHAFYTTIPVSYNYIVVGENVLAVEIHKYSSLPSINSFDATITLIANDEYRLKSGILWSDILTTGVEGIDKLIDNNIFTKTLSGPRCVDAIFQYTYNYDRREYINQYSITNGNDCNKRHPSSWRFEGSNNNGQTWTLLHYVYSQLFTSYRQTVTYDIFTSIPYNSYRILITECDNQPLDSVNCGDGNIQLSELKFFLTNKNPSCIGEEGYTTAMEGDYGYKECISGYKGIRRRKCTNSTFETIQDLCILQSPSILRYEGSPFTLHKGIQVIISPILTGAELIVNIDPPLPNGLVIDNNAIISGTPLESSLLKEYTITVSNRLGTSSTKILISIDTAVCAVDGIWPITEGGSQATLACADPLLYEGSRTRYCNIGTPCFWSEEVDNCKLKIPTIEYPINILQGYKGDSIDVITPVITGGSLNLLTITPSLPKGLVFIDSTGQISGIPIETIDNVYTITISNPSGSKSTLLTIRIQRVVCSIDGEWIETERGEYEYIWCTQGYTGVLSRFCMNKGIGLANWDIIDTSRCYIYDSNERPGENNVFINIPILLKGITYLLFNNPKTYELFRKIFVDLLSSKNILSEHIQITHYNEINEDGIKVYMRYKVEEGNMNEIVDLLIPFIESQTTQNSLLYKCKESANESLRYIETVAIGQEGISYRYNSISGWVITIFVLVILLILILFSVIGLCIYYRLSGRNKLKDRKKSGKKTVPSKGNNKEIKDKKNANNYSQITPNVSRKI